MKSFTPPRKLNSTNLGQIILPPFLIKIINIRAKLTPEEKDSCEANIFAKKCLDALKVMDDGKSPGMDGFTVEFQGLSQGGPGVPVTPPPFVSVFVSKQP